MMVSTSTKLSLPNVVLTLDAKTAQTLHFLLGRNATIPEALVASDDELSSQKIVAFMGALCMALRQADVGASNDELQA